MHTFKNKTIETAVEKFHELCIEKKMPDFINKYLMHTAPLTIPHEMLSDFYCHEFYPELPYRGRVITAFYIRQAVIETCGFVPITQEFIGELKHAICEFRLLTRNIHVLEINGGLGAISAMLNTYPFLDVICTDVKTETSNFNYDKDEWMPVEKLDWVEAVEKYGEWADVVISSWPRGGLLKPFTRLHEINPDAKFIYIGEGPGGCTADDNFLLSPHVVLDEDDDKLINVNEVFPIWEGMHDCVSLFKYEEVVKDEQVREDEGESVSFGDQEESQKD